MQIENIAHYFTVKFKSVSQSQAMSSDLRINLNISLYSIYTHTHLKHKVGDFKRN